MILGEFNRHLVLNPLIGCLAFDQKNSENYGSKPNFLGEFLGIFVRNVGFSAC